MALDDVPDAVLPIERTLDGTLGFELIDVGEEVARARVAVEDRVRQPFGLVHGGVYAALSESLTSIATFLVVREHGMVAMGSSNLTTFLRPVFGGQVHALARRRHRGRTSWVWEVDLTDDDGRLCAMSRVTVAVRPAPS